MLVLEAVRQMQFICAH